uniref:Uncharacterized protein n=1 Tax=Rhizophora mucronata TaxID=61149 RepID=A0A2P2N3U8_RHIMU
MNKVIRVTMKDNREPSKWHNTYNQGSCIQKPTQRNFVYFMPF